MLPVQVRMARAALGWTVRVLAERANVSHDTIVRFERGDELKVNTTLAIQNALVTAGIEFIGDSEDAPGVRLRTK
jgi:transcriptional regulator with XRE-family HTH domain